MKKYLKYIPYIIFAYFMLVMGAMGKLSGAEKAVGLFTKLDLFGMGEAFGRYLIGGAELLAGLGIFFKSTQKYAAGLGIILMLGALYFHATVLGLAMAGPAVVTLLVAIWIFVKSKTPSHDHSKCTDGTCEIK